MQRAEAGREASWRSSSAPVTSRASCRVACKPRALHSQDTGPSEPAKAASDAIRLLGPGTKEGHARIRPVSMGRRQLLLGTCSCCSLLSTPQHAHAGTGGWYDNVFAWTMQHGMATYERTLSPIKARMFEQLFSGLDGMSSPDADAGQGTCASEGSIRVLEIGCGTAPNLAYYREWGPESLQVTGLEPNQAMWRYARENAAAKGFTMEEGDGASGNCSAALPGGGRQLRLVAGSAEALPFPDASFDAVVLTLVLCSVSDPRQALAEAARCLRPGGRLLFVEHVVSPEPGLVQVTQRVFDPLQQVLADGCHLTRDTLGTIADSRFQVSDVRVVEFGVATAEGSKLGQALRFSVPALAFLGPHVAGVVPVA